MTDDLAQILFQSFSERSHREQFWCGWGRPVFDVVYSAFRLTVKALPTVQDALKDGFGEAVVARDVTDPCEFLSLYSHRKRSLWTYKESHNSVRKTTLKIVCSSNSLFKLCSIRVVRC